MWRNKSHAVRAFVKTVLPLLEASEASLVARSRSATPALLELVQTGAAACTDEHVSPAAYRREFVCEWRRCSSWMRRSQLLAPL